MSLRQSLCALGAALLLVAAWLLASGHWLFLPHVLIAGLVLTIGVAFERWRYKPPLDGPPDPSWRDTGERCSDPASGTLVAVYSDASGARHYVKESRTNG
ncbi:MAG TPA: hypothetical protein VFG73_05915 [Rhodanobacteraceae bacterium]|nr:hypothetical protein [Rhodanobacteraceae bacterium]